MQLFTETIHYSVTDAKDALNKIRQFALTLPGWAVDYWQQNVEWDASSPYGWISGSEDHLQLFCKGYVNQNMTYRMMVEAGTSGEQLITTSPIVPQYRYHQVIATEPLLQNSWAILNAKTSLPSGTFDALYLYGSSTCIIAVFKVSAVACITLFFGTPELFRDWWYYSDGLQFNAYPGATYSIPATHSWYNMNSNKSQWANPLAFIANNVSYTQIYYEDTAIASGYGAGANYQPTSIVEIGSETGIFGKMNGILNYNAYTNKRVAFQSTYFVQHPSTLVYYPIGLSPCIFINGLNLSIGDTVDFGTDQYRVFPLVFIDSNIWVGYRIA